MHLKALKPIKYMTRRLLPGDVFEMDRSKGGQLHAAVLLATRKVVSHRVPGHVPPPPAELLAKVEPVAPEPVALPELPAPVAMSTTTVGARRRRRRATGGA